MGEARRRMMAGNMPMMMPGAQQQQFDIREATPKQCVKCKGVYFDKAYRLALISPVAPGNKTGQEIRVHYDAYLCRACGHEFGAVLPVVK